MSLKLTVVGVPKKTFWTKGCAAGLGCTRQFLSWIEEADPGQGLLRRQATMEVIWRMTDMHTDVLADTEPVEDEFGCAVYDADRAFWVGLRS